MLEGDILCKGKKCFDYAQHDERIGRDVSTTLNMTREF